MPESGVIGPGQDRSTLIKVFSGLKPQPDHRYFFLPEIHKEFFGKADTGSLMAAVELARSMAGF